MKYLFVLVFLLGCSAFANTPVTTEVLALKLWNAMEKGPNASYTALDNYRLKLDKDDPTKKTLADPNEFKRMQNILRNKFIDRVSKEFNRKEIINLTKIYLRPEMEKMRVFALDFWDEKLIKEFLDQDHLFNNIK